MNAAALKPLPHSVDAEQAVLGALMLDNSRWDQVHEELIASDFYRSEHRLIFDAMVQQAAASKPIDVITLSEALSDSNQLQEAGGLDYLGALVTNIHSAANVIAYAKIVKERSLYRRMIAIGHGLADLGLNGEGDLAERMAKVREIVAELESDEKRYQLPGARFEFSTIGGMLQNPRPPQWLIKGVIQQDSTGTLYGEPGHGKSFLAIDIAACIATGAEWHGHKTNPGAVFYIAGEGKHGLSMRFMAWSIERRMSLQDAPLAVSSTPIALNDPGSAMRVKLAVKAMAEHMGRAPALIVVDTLARNFAGDENSTKDMNDFIRALDYLRADAGWQASILIVHHSGKDVTKGARGSSVLKAAVDTEYAVSMDENKIVAFQSCKMKDGAPPPPKAFQLKGVKLPFVDEDGADIWSCVPVLVEGEYSTPRRGSQGRGKNQQLALACLVSLYREREAQRSAKGLDPSTTLVSIEDWRKHCVDSGMDRKRFAEAKLSLVNQCLIELFPLHVRIV